MSERDPPEPTMFFPCNQNAALAATLVMADSIGASLATARSLLQSGRNVNLTGLEDLCGRLCARSLDLPPEQGKALTPRLEALRDALDVTTRMICGQPEP